MAAAKKRSTSKKGKAATPSPIPIRLLRLFQEQIAHQCGFALRAADDLINQRDTWYSAQNLLVAVGNISKALWGTNTTTEILRKPLRDSLGVGEESALKVRDIRNHWEHFDERLDEWWRDSPAHFYIDRNIGSGPIIGGLVGGPGVATIKPLDVFSNYDSAAGELTFWGDTFSVPAIVAELEHLHLVAKAESDKPHWESANTSGSRQ